MSKIIVLCGPIASGKSTYCKNAALKGQIIINDDAIVTMLHGDNYTYYDKQLKPLYKSTENHILSIALSMGKTVVVDRGLNLSLKGRKRWLSLAESYDVPCEVINFPIEDIKVHAERRTKSDARGHDLEYWSKVAEHHLKYYQAPTFSEGFSEIYNITFAEIQAGKVIV